MNLPGGLLKEFLFSHTLAAISVVTSWGYSGGGKGRECEVEIMEIVVIEVAKVKISPAVSVSSRL